MDPLAGPAIEAVREGDTTFVPDHFKKIYFNWMEGNSRLVHLASTLVGTPYSRMVLRRLRRDRRVRGDSSFMPIMRQSTIGTG